jgi:phage N-6-adenine-methyltransferase
MDERNSSSDRPDAILVPMMTQAEARACVERIKRGLDTARRELLRLHDAEGWRALGYRSWRECGEREFSYSQSHLYRLLTAAEIERDIGAEFSPIGENPGAIPESHLRPLAKLPEGEREPAWHEARTTAPEGGMSAAHVEGVVQKRLILKALRGGKPKPSPRRDPPERIVGAITIPAADRTWEIEDESGDTPPAPDATIRTLTSSARQNWRTPRAYVEAAREALGGTIDLDPASDPEANATVGAAAIWTDADDGLRRDWHGRVFVNPPYGKTRGRSNAGLWSEKLIAEYRAGRVEAAILLVNAATGDGWFQPLFDYPICFTRRISFIDADTGEGMDDPTHGNAFVYFGPDPGRFAEVFNRVGVVMKRWGA